MMCACTHSSIGKLSSRGLSGHSGGGRFVESGSTDENTSVLFVEEDVSCCNSASFLCLRETTSCWWTASTCSCSSRSAWGGQTKHFHCIMQFNRLTQSTLNRHLTIVNFQHGWAGDCAKGVVGDTFKQAWVFWKGLSNHQCTQLLCKDQHMDINPPKIMYLSVRRRERWMKPIWKREMLD